MERPILFKRVISLPSNSCQPDSFNCHKLIPYPEAQSTFVIFLVSLNSAHQNHTEYGNLGDVYKDSQCAKFFLPRLNGFFLPHIFHVLCLPTPALLWMMCSSLLISHESTGVSNQTQYSKWFGT